MAGAMAITRIKVSNFKSFDELEVDLRPLSIVVGANAAGKSNFLEIFRFIRDLAAHGLENAVSLQGGMKYLANLKIGAARPVILEATFDFPRSLEGEGIDEEYAYKLVIDWEGDDSFIVIEDSPRLMRSRIFEKSGEKFSAEGSHLFFSAISPGFSEALAIFDLNPSLAKRSTTFSGKADLEPDGSNLAIVLRRILRDDENRQAFIRLFKDALPFVEDVKVDELPDQSLLLALRESYAKDSFLPALLLSEGTVYLVALIIALYFDRRTITLIEDLERDIHPHLISKVISMMQDASRRKQIVATTHSPQVVRSADIKDLLLIYRDADGFSRVSRPAEDEDLRVFLENDFGIDELYIQDLLRPRNGL